MYGVSSRCPNSFYYEAPVEIPIFMLSPGMLFLIFTHLVPRDPKRGKEFVLVCKRFKLVLWKNLYWGRKYKNGTYVSYTDYKVKSVATYFPAGKNRLICVAASIGALNELKWLFAWGGQGEKYCCAAAAANGDVIMFTWLANNWRDFKKENC